MPRPAATEAVLAIEREAPTIVKAAEEMREVKAPGASGSDAEADAAKKAGPSAAPKPPRKYKTKPMNPRYAGENLPGNKVWNGSPVKYLSEQERAACKLSFKDGKIYDADGNLFDTSDASSHFAGQGKAIFVMDEDGNFYASKFHEPGAFHHSSLMAGQPVAAAGEMEVDSGVLKTLTDGSGHYMPDREFTLQGIDQLGKNEVDLGNVQFNLWSH